MGRRLFASRHIHAPVLHCKLKFVNNDIGECVRGTRINNTHCKHIIIFFSAVHVSHETGRNEWNETTKNVEKNEKCKIQLEFTS